VLHRLRAELAHQKHRRRAARAAIQRSRPPAVPRRHRPQPGRVLRRVRRAYRPAAVSGPRGARARLVAREPTTMRVTVCELPHAPDALARAWSALFAHTA